VKISLLVVLFGSSPVRMRLPRGVRATADCWLAGHSFGGGLKWFRDVGAPHACIARRGFTLSGGGQHSQHTRADHAGSHPVRGRRRARCASILAHQTRTTHPRGPRKVGRNMNRSGDVTSASGFTLIELMISIAIVSVLIGLSASGLAYAREASRSAVCAASLRGLGTAVTLYRDQSKGALPYAAELYSLPAGWTDPLTSLEGFLDVPLPSLDGGGHVMTRAPFLCPSDTEYGPALGMSYPYMPSAFMQVASRASRAAEQVTRMYEDDPTGVIFQDQSAWHFARSKEEPRGSRNLLGMDGSVRSVRMK